MTEAAPYFADLAAGPDTARAAWRATADGRRVRVVLWPHPGARGTVLILTGRSEHAEKYGPTAAALAAAGLAAATVDWRGQGLSERLLPDPRKGHVGRFADYQHDLRALIAAVDDAALPGPRFLMAHSMGGAIGLRALIEGLAVRAAVFSAPMWGIKVPAGRAGPIRAMAGLAVGLGLGARYAPPPASGPVCYAESAPFAGNTLTTDPDAFAWMQGHFAAHPELATAGPTFRWLHEALAECDRLAQAPSPALPALAGLGSHERVVDRAAVTDRMARWPGGRLLALEGAEHELLIERPPIRGALLAAATDLFAAHGG